METRLNNQVAMAKKELKNRVEFLVTQLDIIANKLEIELDNCKMDLKKYLLKFLLYLAQNDFFFKISTNKINMTKYQQFNAKAMSRYEQLKHDVEKYNFKTY